MEETNLMHKPNEIRTGYLISYIITITLGSFMFGYSISEVNPLKDVLRGAMGWDQDGADKYFLIGTNMGFVGAMFGSLTGGFIVAKYGRRGAMILLNIILWVACGILMIQHTAAFLVGRTIFGYCGGFFSYLVPLFIREVVPVEKGGAMGCINQLQVTMGILVATLVGLCAPQVDDDDAEQSKYDDISDSWSWRVVFAVPLLVSTIQMTLLFTFYVHETPKFLMHQGDPVQARNALSLMYKVESRVDSEMGEFEKASKGEIGFKAMFTRRYRQVMLVGCLLCVFQQLTGINALMAYSTDIYNNAGQTGNDGVICTNIQNLINMLFVVVSMFTADLWGRKKLLLLGSFLCGLTMFLAGLGVNMGWNIMALVMFYAFIAAFEISHGPICWVYTAEILPSSGMSLAVGLNWVFCIIVCAVAPPLLNSINGWVFIIFAIFMGLAMVYTIFMIKETKGLSELEIQKLFWKEEGSFIDPKVKGINYTAMGKEDVEGSNITE